MQHLSKETAGYLVRCHIENVTNKTARPRRHRKKLSPWAIVGYGLTLILSVGWFIIIAAGY